MILPASTQDNMYHCVAYRSVKSETIISVVSFLAYKAVYSFFRPVSNHEEWLDNNVKIGCIYENTIKCIVSFLCGIRTDSIFPLQPVL